MAANYKHELVGAFGSPIAENPTGLMQEAAFNALGMMWRYLLLEVHADSLADAVNGVRALGFRGFNLTIPHKVAVIPLLDDVAADARMIGAVNTVRRVGDALIGENTDGKGFLRGLREDGQIEPTGKRVVILGAGGAARAIAVELILAGASEVTIVNRGKERGETMVADLRDKTGHPAQLIPWQGTYPVPRSTDILVNATSIGLYPDVDAMPDVGLDDARPDLVVCDVIPNPPDTPLLKLARSRGLKALNGLAMLVYQGSTAFEMWAGVKPPEDVMKQALESAFGLR